MPYAEVRCTFDGGIRRESELQFFHVYADRSRIEITVVNCSQGLFVGSSIHEIQEALTLIVSLKEPSSTHRKPFMKAVAIRQGQVRERAPGYRNMGTLRCDGCGETFVIFHEPSFVSERSAERQALWLEKVLAEEHQREQRHPDRIQLPD